MGCLLFTPSHHPLPRPPLPPGSISNSYVFAARIVDGFFCGNIGVTKTYLGELVDKENEAFAFSVLAFCFSWGQIIGGALGGYLAEPARTWPSVFGQTLFDEYPYLLPNALYGSVAALAWLVGLFSLRESLPPEERRWSARSGSVVSLGRQFWLVCTMYVLQRGYYTGWSQNWVLSVQVPADVGGFGFSITDVGIITNLSGLALLFNVVVFYPRVCRWFGLKRVYIVAWLFTLCVVLLFPFYLRLPGRTLQFVAVSGSVMVAQIAAGCLFPTIFVWIYVFF